MPKDPLKKDSAPGYRNELSVIRAGDGIVKPSSRAEVSSSPFAVPDRSITAARMNGRMILIHPLFLQVLSFVCFL
jgi:hypothetical protein